MTTKIIEVVQDNKLYDLNFTLKNSDDTVIDLTDSTILFKVQGQDTDTIKFSGSMTIVSAAAGTCKYNVANGDFDTVGKHTAQIQVTYSGGQIVTIPGIVVHVLPKLAQDNV